MKFTFDINSGESKRVAHPGDYIYIVTAAVTVLIQTDNGREYPMTQGDSVRINGGFESFVIKNDSGGNDIVTFTVTQGDEFTKAPPSSVTVSKPATLDSKPDVSLLAAATTQIIASNSARKKITIGNLATNAQTFRIGDSGAGAANGIELAPGQSVEIENTAAIYGYNPGAGAESVAVVEES